VPSGSPARQLRGRIRDGVSVPAVDAFGARIVAAAPCMPRRWGAKRARRGQRGVHARGGQNPVGANPNAPAGQRAQPDWHGSSRGHQICRRSPPIGVGGVSIAQPPWRSRSIVVAVRRGDAAACARVAGLARQVDAGLHLRISSPSTTSSREQIRMVVGSVVLDVLFVALVFSAAGLRAHGRRRGASHPRIGIRITRHNRHVLGSVFARAVVSSAAASSRQQPHPAPRVARRQPDRGSPVSSVIRPHHGGWACWRAPHQRAGRCVFNRPGAERIDPRLRLETGMNREKSSQCL
jgi:hypothetical protein